MATDAPAQSLNNSTAGSFQRMPAQRAPSQSVSQPATTRVNAPVQQRPVNKNLALIPYIQAISKIQIQQIDKANYLACGQVTASGKLIPSMASAKNIQNGWYIVPVFNTPKNLPEGATLTNVPNVQSVQNIKVQQVDAMNYQVTGNATCNGMIIPLEAMVHQITETAYKVSGKLNFNGLPIAGSGTVQLTDKGLWIVPDKGTQLPFVTP